MPKPLPDVVTRRVSVSDMALAIGDVEANRQQLENRAEQRFALLQLLLRIKQPGDVFVDANGSSDVAMQIAQRRRRIDDGLESAVETLDADELGNRRFTFGQRPRQRPLLCGKGLTRLRPPALVDAVTLRPHVAHATPDLSAGFVAAHDVAVPVRDPHADGQQLENARECSLARMHPLIQPLALGDVTHVGLPLSGGQYVRADLHGHPVPVLVAQHPFLGVGTPLQHDLPGRLQADPVAFGDQVENRLAQDIGRLAAEDAATRLVDVDISAMHVRDEDTIGSSVQHRAHIGLTKVREVFHGQRFG
jgi:hypothetical protein